jgi:hypothetical protein
MKFIELAGSDPVKAVKVNRSRKGEDIGCRVGEVKNHKKQ